MKKIALGPQTLIYPMPAFLIGASVDGKPNFMTAAWSGIAASTPPMITVALQHHRYTLKGIKENGAFSVNVPSAKLAKETDYCGLVSGTTKADKVKECNFKIFYGKTKNAPLIEQCPVNLECKVVHTSYPWLALPGDRADRGSLCLRRLPDEWRARSGENRPDHIRNRRK